MGAYKSFRLDRLGQVATVTMLRAHSHEEIADVFVKLRSDDNIRVVVPTGSDGMFHVPAAASYCVLLDGVSNAAKWLAGAGAYNN